MGIKCTPEERAVLESWPAVTGEDIGEMNDLFPHYIFFRRTRERGGETTAFHMSCCGRREELHWPRRTETPWERELLDARHNDRRICPWCGRSVTMKDLGKAGKRKKLADVRFVMLLHGKDDALYGDALVLRKGYQDEAALTEKPEYWCSSAYRFALGDVMEVDYQDWGDGVITHERERLGKTKLVREPFKCRCISGYNYEPYVIIGRSAVDAHPIFRYCQYFERWRKAETLYCDFVEYITAYCLYPRQIEMLVKAGLTEPVWALIYTRKKFAAAMNWDQPDIRKAMGLTRAELKWVLEYKPPMETLECRNRANRWFGLNWDAARAEAFCRTFDHADAMDALRLCRKYRLDPERLERYLADQVASLWGEGLAGSPAQALEQYQDYLDAAYCLGRCMEHGKVLWPEDLRTAHDETTDAFARAELELEEQVERGNPAADSKARKEKYEFELDGLKIVFPVTAAAIRREGKRLSHCVGGYAKRHMDGVLTILFLRRADTPHVPYVTIEMQGNQIRQIHGYKNDVGGVDPRRTHKAFLDTWLQWLKAGSPRNEDGTPRAPRKRKKEGAA